MLNRNPCAIRRGANPLAFRPRLEGLEDRSVPATFTVTTALDVVDATDGKRSLREAITAANDTPEADTIVLPAGEFKMALAGAGEDDNATGDFDITGAVTIQGAGAGQTVIDGQQLDRVFDIRGTAPGSIGVTLEKLQVRKGSVTDGGGGIRVGNANLVVRDAVIVGNQAAERGGGISNASAPGTGNVTLVRTTVDRNVAGNGGGGILVESVWGGDDVSVLTIRDSTVRRNTSGDYGGGIYGDRVTLTNSTVSRNYTGYTGGGIHAERITSTNTTFSRNSAAYKGGGIYGRRVVLTNCTVSGNSAERGSAGIAATRVLALNYCTVSGNSRTSPPTLVVTTARDVVNPADGKLSLREAITSANASPEPDTIVLPAGVFTMTRSGAGEDDNATGDFDITSWMTIRGAGAGKTVINGQQLDRVFDARGNPTGTLRVVLEKLQVRNGGVTGDGGGIRVGATSLAVRDSIIAGNQASGNGGGIFEDSGPAGFTLVRTTVARNVAGLNGGGVYAYGTDLNNSTVNDNEAGASGGGIYTTYSVYLDNNTFSGNSAGTDGGGIFTEGFAYLYNSTLSGNTAGSGDGGGLFAQDYASLTNSTVSGNSAGGSGGGVFAGAGSVSHGTVVKNSAQTGGGVFHSPGGLFYVSNTIIALNLIGSGGSGPDVAGDPFTSQGHNLIGINAGTGFTNGVNDDIVGTAASPVDPLIGDLKNNGGRTTTHALLAGSPAIDVGDADSWTTTDQRGGKYLRNKDGNGDGTAVADIGAFEK